MNIKSRWQKWSSGDRQAAKDMYAEDATIESLGKSSTGKQVRTKEKNFPGVIVTTFKFLRCVCYLRTTVTWFGLIGLLLMEWTKVMAALGYETIKNGKITQSVWCRAPAP